MPMEILEFVIFPDGRVQEKVTGIIGTSCQEVTAAIEAQLGLVVSSSLTADYYAQPVQTTEGLAQHQDSWSNWP